MILKMLSRLSLTLENCHRLATLLVLLAAASASAGDFVVESNAESTALRRQIRAAQFLQCATFGPTSEEIEALSVRMGQIGIRPACEEWIDSQWDVPATEHLSLVREMMTADGYTGFEREASTPRYRHYAWWHAAIAGRDQLRQRVAWALIQIFTTSEFGFGSLRPGNITGTPKWFGPTDYYDLMVRSADGNYRTLLHDVSYHPVMGDYLSHLRNRKTDGDSFPDENFARELMQLFSIGLFQLNQDGSHQVTDEGELIPTYDNHAIREIAKVFTGLTQEPTPGQNFWVSGTDYTVPMVMHQSRHESGTKQPFSDLIIDEDSGDDEIAKVLDYLCLHQNVAPFICYRLIQRLVRSNPSTFYVQRVARVFEDNGQGVRGDLKAVIKAILTDPQVFQGITTQRVTNPLRVRVSSTNVAYSRLKEPVVRYAGFLRTMRPTSSRPEGWFMCQSFPETLGQAPYKQPSVFGFYLPNHEPPGTLSASQVATPLTSGSVVGPEFNLLTQNPMAGWINLVTRQIAAGKAEFVDKPTNATREFEMRCTLTFDWQQERLLLQQPNGLSKIIDLFDIRYCNGAVPTSTKNAWVALLRQEIPSDANQTDNLIKGALSCVLTSPYAAVIQ